MRKLRRTSPFLQENLKHISPEIQEMCSRHLDMCDSLYSAEQGDVFIRRDTTETVFDGKQTKDEEEWYVLIDQFGNQLLYDKSGLPYLTLDDNDPTTLISKKK